MHKMEELKEMLCEELDKITKKGERSAGSLDVIDKLTHSIKSIETIMAMSDYSGDNYSYARGRGSNANRDSRGRYSSDDYSMARGGNYSRNNSYARGRMYSGDDMSDLKEHLEELEDMVSDSRAKKMIKQWKRELD